MKDHTLESCPLLETEAATSNATASTRASVAMPGSAEQPEAEVTVGIWQNPDQARATITVQGSDTLLDLVAAGAVALSTALLPSAEEPLDRLRRYGFQETVGAHLDLALTLDEFLNGDRPTTNFDIELVRAIKVNTRWRIAPSASMNPKEILGLADLDWQEYSLYHPGESEPLPLETSLDLDRGDEFEAQRDGKYGGVAVHADRNRQG